MKKKSCPQQRNFYFLTAIFLLLISQTVAGQSVAKAQKDFDKLNSAYSANRISDSIYLHKAIDMTDHYWSDGIHFKTQELVDLLTLYKEIAWSKKEYATARLDYFNVFANNASVSGQTGAVMYYSDKRAEESKRNGQNFLLEVDYSKVQIFMEQDLYNKVISIYVHDKPYIKRLPEQLRNRKILYVEGMNALSILAEVIDAYIKIKDTAAVYQTKLLADQIGNALKSIYPINRQSMLGNDFYMLLRQHQIALFEGNQTKVGAVLDNIQILKTTYKNQPAGYIDWTLYRLKIDHYLAVGNPDSTRLYIKKFESLPAFLQNQQAIVDEYKAKLQALQSDFKGGYTLLSGALAGERKIKSSMMTEMDNLLYAYTEAENSRIDLQQSEAVKKQRTLWLVIISCSAAITILAIYMIMLYRNGKAKAQIEALNNAACIQIIAMEEAKHQAVREEQQRLGQDLHDGLSSSVAAFRHQLETISMDIEDIALRNKFSALRVEMAKAYETIRTKSHEWFSAADQLQEVSFEKQIKLLTDIALPDSRFDKTIHIDDKSFVGIGTETRIALLRIIQEAVTNIIKHAKAKTVDILIYEENDKLILTISDDGIGLSEKKSGEKKATMGLASIRRRVQYLAGETEINSSTKGTEIVVSIPLVLA